jgi:ferritin-like metal-binding protein YciE
MPQSAPLLMMLNDVLATENALIPMLQSHAANFSERHEIRQRLEQHLEATRGHVERVKECIARLEGDPSATKEALGTLAGMAGALGLDVLPGQLLKMVVADYAAENVEIASYEAIITVAEGVGDDKTAQVARKILQEEEEMAAWLRSQIPAVSQMQVLQLEHST